MRRVKRAMLVLAVLAAGACGSKGCSCTQPIKGGYPVAERHEGAMQIRATQSLFQFVSDNGPALLPKLLPTGAVFNVPPSCGGSQQICCAMPAPMCRLQFAFQRVSITPQAPSGINLDTDFQLKTLDNLPVDFSGAHCIVSLDTTRSGGSTMNLKAQLNLPVDQTTDLAGIAVANPTVTGIDDGDVNFAESGSDFLCNLGSLPGIKGFIVGQLESQVAGQLTSAIGGQACMTCTTKDDCNSFAANCMSGQCVDSKMNCVQELGFESKLDVGALLASFAPGTQASMDFLAVAGGWSVADTGLSLGMLGGGRGDPHSACVPMVPAPTPPPITPSTTFFTDVLPDGAQPYHLGIGIHRTELDSLGWGAFDAGALCLHIGSQTVPQLSSKTIGLVIPSLADLVHVPDAPLFLAFRPAQPPTFVLGKGTFKTDPMTGVKKVDDALLHVSVPDFAINFYAFVDDRYVRVMTLTADLELPISLDVDGMGQIVPLIGDVSDAFTNVRVSNSELLGESPGDLAQAFPTLLGVAVGTLTSSLKPIALPALMGINVTPKAITSTDPDGTGVNQFLSIFADLSLAAPARFGADTTAELVKLELPSTPEFAVGNRTAIVPRATVQLGGRSFAGRPLEWSWSIDGGPWAPFTDSATVIIEDPVLWLQGVHALSVRARAQGLPETLDLSPAELRLVVDTVPPEGSFDDDGEIAATDRVSDSLVYRYRPAGGSFSEWSTVPSLPKSLVAGAVVQARDEAGNIGILEFHGRTTAPPSSSGCGCSVGGAPSSTGALAIAVLALLIFRRRIWILLLFAGCNEAGLKQGDFEPPIHEIGRYHDVALDVKGAFHVSAYDDATGDLAYAKITDITKNFGWQYVDGIDPTAIVDMPGDYRHGVSDPGPDVGMYSSIALTHSGAPRIAYYDATNGALKYAAGPHPWKISTVQAGDGAHEKVGLFTQISLDENDLPTIAFMATGISDGMGGFTSELRVAQASNPHPSTMAEWKITTVDTTRIRCAGLCPDGQACIQLAMVGGMPNGDPAQSTCQATTSDCMPACTDTQGCLAGTCTAALQPVPGDLPEGTGLFAQLRRTKSGLTLVYHDRAEGDLKLATQSGASWTVTTLDGGDPTTDRGQFCSAQYASDGTLHVAYVDAIADQLLHVAVTGPSPSPEVIDDGMRDDGPHSVGAGAALHVNGTSLEVVYQDQVVSDLLIARDNGGWSHQPLDAGLAGFGWWPHLVSDGKTTWLTQFVYDRAAGNPIGSFVIEKLP